MKFKAITFALIAFFPSVFFAQVVEPIVLPTPPKATVWVAPEEVTPKEIGPNDFILLENEATPLNFDEFRKALVYPKNAKAQEIEGKVIVRILVDEGGNYVKHILLKNPHDELTAEVERNLSHLKFEPAYQLKKPIMTWVTIPFDFRLTD